MLLMLLILAMSVKAEEYGVFMKTFDNRYCVVMADGVKAGL